MKIESNHTNTRRKVEKKTLFSTKYYFTVWDLYTIHFYTLYITFT